MIHSKIRLKLKEKVIYFYGSVLMQFQYSIHPHKMNKRSFVAILKFSLKLVYR